MANNFYRVHHGYNWSPQTGTPSNLQSGDFWYDAASDKLQAQLGVVTDKLVAEATSAALTNKTIDATFNTLSNITDSSIATAAAIAYSKLSLSNSIVDGDISSSAAIAYSKLDLGLSIVDGDISTTAAIAYSKLNLSSSIVDGDISSSAAIAGTKIDPDFGSQNIKTTGNATIGGELKTELGSDNSSTGTLNDVSSTNTSFFRFTNNSAPTITGFANGANGKRLVICYTGSGILTINNNDSGSSAANRIITGTGDSLKISSGATIELIYDSTASLWRVVDNGLINISNWQSFTPTGTWTSNVTYSGMWRRVGDSLECQVFIDITGTPGSGTLLIDVPFSLNIDTSKIISTIGTGLGSSGAAIGITHVVPVPGTDAYGPTLYYSTTQVQPAQYIVTTTVGQGSINPTSPYTLDANDGIECTFRVPIVGWRA